MSSQRSLHSAPMFRLVLKVAVNGTHQCDFHNFLKILCSNCYLNEMGIDVGQWKIVESKSERKSKGMCWVETGWICWCKLISRRLLVLPKYCIRVKLTLSSWLSSVWLGQWTCGSKYPKLAPANAKQLGVRSSLSVSSCETAQNIHPCASAGVGCKHLVECLVIANHCVMAGWGMEWYFTQRPGAHTHNQFEKAGAHTHTHDKKGWVGGLTARNRMIVEKRASLNACPVSNQRGRTVCLLKICIMFDGCRL